MFFIVCPKSSSACLGRLFPRRDTVWIELLTWFWVLVIRMEDLGSRDTEWIELWTWCRVECE